MMNEEDAVTGGEYARGVQDGYALALKHIRNQVDRLEEYQNDRA